MVDLVSRWLALPYSQAAHYGWLHFQAEEKMRFLTKAPDQSIH